MTPDAERLAQGLVSGTAILVEDAARADPVDLAATLELYVRVAAWPRLQRRAAGLEPAFQAATQAWVTAGSAARARAFEGLQTDALVDMAYQLADGDEPDEETVVGWAAGAVRAALVVPWLDPEDRVKVQDAIGELTSVADTHPNIFMAASMVAQLLTEAEPVDRWPREASELLSLFARLPLLALVDGEI